MTGGPPGPILYIYYINTMDGDSLNLIISNSDKRPIYEQIYQQIKDLIVSDQLEASSQLPSIRSLAKDLRISVITTKRAYDELEAEGLVETVPGKGTFVAHKNQELIREEIIKKIEGSFTEAITTSRLIDLSLDDLIEILNILYKEF